LFESPSRIFCQYNACPLTVVVTSSLITSALSVFLGRAFRCQLQRNVLPKWGFSPTYPVLGALLVFLNIELARDPYRPLMPFKLHYHVEHVVIEFTNIVVALRLIVAFTLWVWLYIVALLLAHYNGPLYFNRV